MPTIFLYPHLDDIITFVHLPQPRLKKAHRRWSASPIGGGNKGGLLLLGEFHCHPHLLQFWGVDPAVAILIKDL